MNDDRDWRLHEQRKIEFDQRFLRKDMKLVGPPPTPEQQEYMVQARADFGPKKEEDNFCCGLFLGCSVLVGILSIITFFVIFF